MVKNCQFLVLQFDDLSVSKLLEVDMLLSMFSGSMLETKSTRENGMCIRTRTILMKPKTKMQFIPLMFTRSTIKHHAFYHKYC